MAKSVTGVVVRGIPTGPDVDKLMALALRPGDDIGYGQVETVVGVSQNEPRFRTVTNAWRRRLFREYGYRVKCEGRVFTVLRAPEALSVGIKGLGRTRRMAARETVYAAAIDTAQLSSDEQSRHMLFRRHAAALLGHAQDVCRAIAPPRSLPTK